MTDDAIDTDAALAEWIDDVSAAVEDDLRRASVPWDFAAMLARAHALDASVVSAEAVREAQQAEPVIALSQRRAQRGTKDDPEFARMVEDVRAATEHDAALRMHGIVPLRAPAPATGRRVVVAVIALAAALVLAFGLVEGVTAVRTDGDAPADAALHQGGVSDAAPEPVVIEDRRAPATPAATAPVVVEPAIIAPPPEAAAPTKPVVVGKARKPKPTEPAVVQPSLTERLAALDGEAHAAWKAGELALAEEKFEALIALAGRSRLADLAYGDLFTLARRRGDADREVALWKRYLGAFAEGRFADDARAGLCRRDAADRAECWRAYLTDFPQGSYRAQAEREAGGAP